MTLITTSAPGAEMATKASPLGAKPTSSWTGFYAGLSTGGAWANMHSELALAQNNGSSAAGNAALASAGSAGSSPSSFAVGAQLGYNYQFAPQFVAGVEVDWSYLGLSAARQAGLVARGPDPAADLREEAQIRSLATLRGRIGWLATPQVLLFATGGLALADIGYSERVHFVQVPDVSANTGSVSGWRTGPVVGAGAEYAFASNWSIKAEYLYASFKPTGFLSANSFDPRYQLRHEVDAKVSTGRIGINYRF